MIELVLFDLDGTLIESFLEDRRCERCDGTGHRTTPEPRSCEDCRGKGTVLAHRDMSYDDVRWLPGRLERLKTLARDRIYLGVCTNQTGVHYGYQTREQVKNKAETVLRETRDAGILEFPIDVCFEPGPFRKPEPGMLNRMMEMHGAPAWRTLFVGDMNSDREAAERAGTSFAWADAFFAAEMDER